MAQFTLQNKQGQLEEASPWHARPDMVALTGGALRFGTVGFQLPLDCSTIKGPMSCARVPKEIRPCLSGTVWTIWTQPKCITSLISNGKWWGKG
jgi:hypothetical protein